MRIVNLMVSALLFVIMCVFAALFESSWKLLGVEVALTLTISVLVAEALFSKRSV